MRMRGGPRRARNARVGVRYTAQHAGQTFETVHAAVFTHAVIGKNQRAGAYRVIRWCRRQEEADQVIKGLALFGSEVWSDVAIVPAVAGAKETA